MVISKDNGFSRLPKEVLCQNNGKMVPLCPSGQRKSVSAGNLVTEKSTSNRVLQVSAVK